MFADFRLVTTAVVTARAASKVTEVYMYQVSRVSPLSRANWAEPRMARKCQYVFDLVTADTSQFEERDRTIARAMAGAWVQFAKTGTQTVVCLNGQLTVRLSIRFSTTVMK